MPVCFLCLSFSRARGWNVKVPPFLLPSLAARPTATAFLLLYIVSHCWSGNTAYLTFRRHDTDDESSLSLDDQNSLQSHAAKFLISSFTILQFYIRISTQNKLKFSRLRNIFPCKKINLITTYFNEIVKDKCSTVEWVVLRYITTLQRNTGKFLMRSYTVSKALKLMWLNTK